MSASRQTPFPPAHGFVESLVEENGLLHVSGWMLTLDGPFDGFRAVGPSCPPDVQVRPVDRPDLAQALPVPGARHGGFALSVPVALRPGETFELTVLGLRGGLPAGSIVIGYHRPPTEQPFPPIDIMHRATRNESTVFWRATGIKACNDFLRALAPHIDLGSIRALLDWGCGSGRVTKHLIDRLPGARVYGTDIDVEAVTWARDHLTTDNATFVPCRTHPPLPFADGQFDVIVALSVFTHLTESYQAKWLSELRRIVRPGGVVLATTQGGFAARWPFRDSELCRQLAATGFSDEIPDPNLGHVVGTDYYRSTFQTQEYTERAWGRYFDVLDYIEAGKDNHQDIVLMRHPERAR